MTEVSETTLRRIRSLLSLAGNNPNEHEAAAASQKALELMEQYNIDAATLDTSVKRRGERKQNFTAGGLYGWQRKLWEGVAKLNFCMYWCEKGLKKGDKYQHKVLGSATNVLSMGLMAEYLQNAVERLAQQYAKEHRLNVFCRDMIAYREGMAARLVERLEQLRKERLEEERRRAEEERAKQSHPGYAGSGTALVLADLIHTEEDYNNDFLYGYEPGTHARWRAERAARDAVWKAEYDEKQRLHKERYANDPEYKAAYDRASAEASAEQAAGAREGTQAAREERWQAGLRRMGLQDLQDPLPGRDARGSPRPPHHFPDRLREGRHHRVRSAGRQAEAQGRSITP
jgi:hypothetical protein